MRFICFIFIFLFASVPANATIYKAIGRGQVSDVFGFDGTMHPPPPGLITPGDNFTFSFEFSDQTAQLQSLFEDDPSINIYYLPSTNFVLKFPQYLYNNDQSFVGNSQIQLWNNASGNIDSQSFSFFGRGHQPLPFDTGAGDYTEGVFFNAYDFTGLTRNSDAISEISDPSNFSTKSFRWLQLDLVSGYSVHAVGTYSLTISAVPEPSTWIMMVFGFGLAGTALRQAPKRRPTN